jgi:hypothetical protein
MNSYELSRKFWDFAFENPDRIKPIHAAIYFFAIEHCNRLGWKEKFGLPSQMVMEAIGVKNWRTYSQGLNELIEFDFIKLIEKSTNQYSSNIIAIVNFTKADTKALDKALQKHGTKQGQSIVSIDKQETIEQETNNNIDIVEIDYEFYFKEFWNIYDKKLDRSKCFGKWKKINTDLYDLIIDKAQEYVNSTPDIKYRKNPLTWLNGNCWEDEIINDVTTLKQIKNEQFNANTAEIRRQFRGL